ncbi:MAG: 4-(cytidine 5'-diphospho)-2-C-methyl-D-erythritol kinase [Prosthecochloris sp.]|nr:4-(cytidine 5'-diphospho)-2-C-methyl-D-erythritol kinase [Prosthecochloris sp.]
MESISVKAYAKINIGLFITGKRPDGYHTLETVFAPVNWYDRLVFRLSASLSMSCSNQDLPCDDGNLCIRAARALQEYAGVTKGADIMLEKNIPFGAGLGGGSSDAAATLRALDTLWGTGVAAEDLHRIATGLGADVPYFLESRGLSYATGIGEQLEDLDLLLPFHVVTIFPGEHISTVWAYRNFHRRFDRQVPDLKVIVRNLCSSAEGSLCAALENDFESAVFEAHPVVRQARSELVDAGGFYAALSGSGSAVFGLFYDEDTALKAVRLFEGRYPVSYTPALFSMA